MTTQNQVSIPLEQGRVFRRGQANVLLCSSRFQSLWSRAGSFDKYYGATMNAIESFNPFGAGQGLSTNVINLFAME